MENRNPGTRTRTGIATKTIKSWFFGLAQLSMFNVHRLIGRLYTFKKCFKSALQ